MSEEAQRGSGNKYTNLISNTVIFGVSTFGSKVLVLLLQRLYTQLLEPAAMGTAEYITSICNFILPIMYLCMAEAVIRFGMEKEHRRADVFSAGFWTVLAGYAVLWGLYPLINRLEPGYTWLIYLYCLTSAMRTLITNFVRASGFVRLFAIDGIFTTATNIAFNLIFMITFDMGIAGYVLGTVAADGLSAICLFVIMRLHRFVKVRGIERTTVHKMFYYALPLIPNAVFWWVTNLSDRTFIRHMCTADQLGLYSKAQLIPNMIILVSAFFTRAWELSAFTEYQSKEGERFFSNVFRSYYTLVFLAASGLILLIKPLTTVLLAPSYFPSWRYSLYLILAVSFSCLVTFLGAIYNAARKNLMVSVTTFIGAVINVGLNLVLIPKSGPEGAAFATFISYFVVFIIRAIDTRRYIKIRMQPWRVGLSLILLVAQVTVAMAEGDHWILWSVVLFLALLGINFGYLLFLLKRLWSIIIKRRAAS